MSNACEILSIESIQKCEVCQKFRESAKLFCGRTVPNAVADVNEVQGMNGKLQVIPGFDNNVIVNILRDTESSLFFWVKLDLIHPEDYTREHVV